MISGVLSGDRSQASAGGRRVTLATLAAALGGVTPLDRPIVLHRTGLDGLFDMVEVVVVDRVERPAAD